MMTFHFSQECMYRISLEEVTWILSLNMKIMLGHHPLASNGIKHQTKKSDLMECLESLAPQPDNIPDVMLVLLMVPPLCRYLSQRNRIIQFPRLLTNNCVFTIHRTFISVQKVVRVDVVWDVCKVDSLKTQTRDNRGYGSWLRVESNTKVPANWNSFLWCEENKISLFQYLL